MLRIVSAVLLVMVYGVEGLTLKQSKKIWVKPIGKSVIFKCEVTDLSTTYVHWYHKKDGGTFKRLLYISQSGSPIEAKDFVAEKNGNSYDIKLNVIKKEHAGVYYCACWDDSDRKLFGSGTRLYVTDKDVAVRPPSLTAYSPSHKHDKKSTMLCQASGMFPDLVKFSWKTMGSSGDWTNVPNEQVVEQRDEKKNEVFVTSMVIVDKDEAKNNNYECIVEHEGSSTPTTHKAKVKPDKVESSEKKPEDGTPNPTCPPPSENTEQNLETISDQTPSLYMFVYAYGIMLMKNGVYFAAVCIFLLKRKAEKKDESSQEPKNENIKQN